MVPITSSSHIYAIHFDIINLPSHKYVSKHLLKQAKEVENSPVLTLGCIYSIQTMKKKSLYIHKNLLNKGLESLPQKIVMISWKITQLPRAGTPYIFKLYWCAAPFVFSHYGYGFQREPQVHKINSWLLHLSSVHSEERC